MLGSRMPWGLRGQPELCELPCGWRNISEEIRKLEPFHPPPEHGRMRRPESWALSLQNSTLLARSSRKDSKQFHSFCSRITTTFSRLSGKVCLGSRDTSKKNKAAEFLQPLIQTYLQPSPFLTHTHTHTPSFSLLTLHRSGQRSLPKCKTLNC